MTYRVDGLASLIWQQLWQVTALIVLVAALARVVGRRRPHLAYLLWLLVVVKCWVPPVWSSPTGLFCWARWERRAAVERGQRAVGRSSAGVDDVTATSVPAAARSPTAGFERPFSVEPPTSISAVDVEGASPLMVGSLLAATWLTGAIACTAVVARSGRRWRRLVAAVTVPADRSLQALADSLARRLGLRRSVPVLVASRPIGPAVFGLARPTMVVPDMIVNSGASEHLEAVVAHELLHVRRGDLLVSLVQVVTQAAWWFHPLVWWANSELKRERERACDEEVVAGLHCEPAAYAQGLLDVLKLKRQLRPWLAAPGLYTVDVTRRRLEHIVSRGAVAHSRTPRRYWLAAAAVALAAIPGATLGVDGPPTAGKGEQPAAAQRTAGDEENQAKAPESQPEKEKTAEMAKTAETAKEPTAEKPQADGDEGIKKEVPRKIADAIELGTKFLRRKQNKDGSWPEAAGYPGGITALCTLALLRCAAPADDQQVQAALERLRKLSPTMTYATAPETMVFCAAEPKRDRGLIRRNVVWLVEQQKRDGTFSGAWGYPMAEGDNSNTGFALMALYAAERVGVEADRDAWQRSRDYYLQAQNVDGSWGYKPGNSGTGSMTAAAMASLAAAADVLDEHDADSPAALALERGRSWLGTNFRVAANPGQNANWWLYYLHAISQAGRVGGDRHFGPHDWYREGVAELLRGQHAGEGFWKGAGHGEDNEIISTSFALLFLAE